MDTVLIGSGNLATNIGFALQKSGHRILQVYSNSIENAEKLANKLKCDYTNNLCCIQTADIYISAVKDSVCNQVWSKLNIGSKLILHTSGSLSMDCMSEYFVNYGVLYPLMTLSKNKIIDFKKIPILVEANSPINENTVFNIAETLSEFVTKADSKQRAQLHLAAVWANNFSNHMFAIAKAITDKNDLPFSLLLPLIEETCNKIKVIPPAEAQTGPAIRYDRNIIEKQENNTPEEFRCLYKQISKSIYNLATKNHEKLL